MSRSGVLGYQSGKGVLLFGVALKAPTGGTFSLLFEGDRNCRAGRLTAPFTSTAPGDSTVLIKNPPPEMSARAGLLAVLTSSILKLIVLVFALSYSWCSESCTPCCSSLFCLFPAWLLLFDYDSKSLPRGRFSQLWSPHGNPLTSSADSLLGSCPVRFDYSLRYSPYPGRISG